MKRDAGSLVDHDPQRRLALDRAITSALCSGELEVAAEYAWEYARITRGSKWYPRDDGVPVPSDAFPKPALTRAKIQHDLEQLQYLRERGLLPDGVAPVMGVYEQMLQGDPEMQLPAETERQLGRDVYGRIIHLRQAPRVERALSRAWDPPAVERNYARANGIAVIDDFLSDESFCQLRLFCLESTVWFTNRYAHGRLGAFFREGFNCPLLVQVAQELRRALPCVIGDAHPLRQMWAFKYNYRQPQNLAHADFAAVNVNFWLTPDEANADARSGGLIIYHIETPLDWDFESYNKDGNKIDALLKEKRASSTVVPYRANRAVIFNSDLFHTTAPICFRDGYENRRINVTMLYGIREEANHLRSSARG